MDTWTVVMLFAEAATETFLLLASAATYLMTFAVTVFLDSLSIFGDHCICTSLGFCALGVVIAACSPLIQEILRASGYWTCLSFGPVVRGLASGILGDWGYDEIPQVHRSIAQAEDIPPSPFTYTIPPDLGNFERNNTSAPNVEKWSIPDAGLLHEDSHLPLPEQPVQETRASLQPGANHNSPSGVGTEAVHSMYSATEAIASDDSIQRQTMMSLDEGHSSVLSFGSPQPSMDRLMSLYTNNLERGSVVDSIEAPSPWPMFIQREDSDESADFDGDSCYESEDLET